MDDFDLILQNGINFGRGGERPKDDGKVKTKAKKKKYITKLPKVLLFYQRNLESLVQF